MTGFFSKIFGGKKKEDNGVESLLKSVLTNLLNKSGLDLSFTINTESSAEKEVDVTIELSGADEDLMKEREGATIDAFQLFLKRVAQHNFSELKVNINIDCNGFREEYQQSLKELADKLKSVAIEKGKSVYIRALSPKDRKVIHQHLAEDNRVKSRSIGDGLYKKIKIFPANNKNHNHEENQLD